LKPTTPQNAAGRITEPFVCVPSASGTQPAATAAAEPEEEPPGLHEGELGGHRLAEHEPAGAAQPLDHDRVALRSLPLEDRRAHLGRQIGGRDDVLHADRHTVERAELRAARAPRVALVREPKRARLVERHPRVDRRVALADAREERFRIRARP
jgi:hypothetical protein